MNETDKQDVLTGIDQLAAVYENLLIAEIYEEPEQIEELNNELELILNLLNEHGGKILVVQQIVRRRYSGENQGKRVRDWVEEKKERFILGPCPHADFFTKITVRLAVLDETVKPIDVQLQTTEVKLRIRDLAQIRKSTPEEFHKRIEGGIDEKENLREFRRLKLEPQPDGQEI